MKLVAVALATILATACYAQAEPMYAGGPPQQMAPQQMAPQQVPPVRDRVLAQFDVNGDGRLEPPERRLAIRQLHRIERQLRREERQERRAARAERRLERRQMRQQQMPPQQMQQPGDPNY